MTGREAVEAAVRREAAKHSNGVFTRQELLLNEQARIQSDSGAEGETPAQTISRCLQELAHDGIVQFVDMNGTYRLIG